MNGYSLSYSTASTHKRIGRGYRPRRLTTRAWSLLGLFLILLFFILLGLPRIFLPTSATHALRSSALPSVGDTQVSVARTGIPARNIAHPADAHDLPLKIKPATSQASSEKPAADRFIAKTLPVTRGDTLMGLLVRAGLPHSEAYNVIAALKDVFNPRHLRQDHVLTMLFESPYEDSALFKAMHLKLNPVREVQVERCAENGFAAREVTHELEVQPVRVAVDITSSLYEAATGAGVPPEVLLQIIRIYGFDVDFQRDIQPQDHFEILFELKVDASGEIARAGNARYASLTTQGRRLPVYRYQTSDGEIDYFDAEGRSLRKTLMITPIDGARISSGYGNRRHPILGYSRMHKGLDFAAPAGTPIMAAGDGVVEYAGRKGSYGNYIRLRHANQYQTVYAHLSRFGRGIRVGARVKQGQTIGYVGSTGMSTGPHLHYEVHHRGHHVNPASIKSDPGRVLKGSELARFMVVKKELDTLFASLQEPPQLARLSAERQ